MPDQDPMPAEMSTDLESNSIALETSTSSMFAASGVESGNDEIDHSIVSQHYSDSVQQVYLEPDSKDATELSDQDDVVQRFKQLITQVQTLAQTIVTAQETTPAQNTTPSLEFPLVTSPHDDTDLQADDACSETSNSDLATNNMELEFHDLFEAVHDTELQPSLERWSSLDIQQSVDAKLQQAATAMDARENFWIMNTWLGIFINNEFLNPKIYPYYQEYFDILFHLLFAEHDLDNFLQCTWFLEYFDKRKLLLPPDAENKIGNFLKTLLLYPAMYSYQILNFIEALEHVEFISLSYIIQLLEKLRAADPLIVKNLFPSLKSAGIFSASNIMALCAKRDCIEPLSYIIKFFAAHQLLDQPMFDAVLQEAHQLNNIFDQLPDSAIVHHQIAPLVIQSKLNDLMTNNGLHDQTDFFDPDYPGMFAIDRSPRWVVFYRIIARLQTVTGWTYTDEEFQKWYFALVEFFSLENITNLQISAVSDYMCIILGKQERCNFLISGYSVEFIKIIPYYFQEPMPKLVQKNSCYFLSLFFCDFAPAFSKQYFAVLQFLKPYLLRWVANHYLFDFQTEAHLINGIRILKSFPEFCWSSSTKWLILLFDEDAPDYHKQIGKMAESLQMIPQHAALNDWLYKDTLVFLGAVVLSRPTVKLLKKERFAYLELVIAYYADPLIYYCVVRLCKILKTLASMDSDRLDSFLYEIREFLVFILNQPSHQLEGKIGSLNEFFYILQLKYSNFIKQELFDTLYTWLHDASDSSEIAKILTQLSREIENKIFNRQQEILEQGRLSDRPLQEFQQQFLSELLEYYEWGLGWIVRYPIHNAVLSCRLMLQLQMHYSINNSSDREEIDKIFSAALLSESPESHMQLVQAFLTVHLDALPSLQKVRENAFSAEEILQLAQFLEFLPKEILLETSAEFFYEALIAQRKKLSQIIELSQGFHLAKSSLFSAMEVQQVQRNFQMAFELMIHSDAIERLQPIFSQLSKHRLLATHFFIFFVCYEPVFSLNKIQENSNFKLLLQIVAGISALKAKVEQIWVDPDTLRQVPGQQLLQESDVFLAELPALLRESLAMRKESFPTKLPVHHEQSVHHATVHNDASKMAQVLIKEIWNTVFSAPYESSCIIDRIPIVEKEWNALIQAIHSEAQNWSQMTLGERSTAQAAALREWESIKVQFTQPDNAIFGVKPTEGPLVANDYYWNFKEPISGLTLKEFIVLLAQLYKSVNQAHLADGANHSDVLMAMIHVFHWIFFEDPFVSKLTASCAGGAFNFLFMLFVSIYNCQIDFNYVVQENVYLKFIRLSFEMASQFLEHLHDKDIQDYLNVVEEIEEKETLEPIWNHIADKIRKKLLQAFPGFIESRMDKNPLFLEEVLANYISLPEDEFKNWMKITRELANNYESEQLKSLCAKRSKPEEEEDSEAMQEDELRTGASVKCLRLSTTLFSREERRPDALSMDAIAGIMQYDDSP